MEKEFLILIFFMVVTIVCGNLTPTHVDYSKVSANHAKVKPSSPTGTVVILDNDLATKLREKHNEYRAEVAGTAKYMFKLSWDDELADMGSNWASQCSDKAPTGEEKNLFKYNVDVNIADIQSDDPLKALEKWHSTKDSYVIEGMSAKCTLEGGYKDCLPYIQMVAATTTRVGCGMAKCSQDYKVVCFYAPGLKRNSIDHDEPRPYFKGSNKCKVKKEGRKRLAMNQDFCDNDQLIDCSYESASAKVSYETSDICYYGTRIKKERCKCYCNPPFQGRMCEKVSRCSNDNQSIKNCQDKQACHITDDPAKGNGAYLAQWHNCFKACNDEYGQTNCGL